MKNPLLFLVFNRPEQTKLVFDKIKEYQPPKLYLAADGPRPGNDLDKINCEKVRQIVSEVDWECEVNTLFNDENLGCRAAVSTAISWFFDKEDQGIILEDDTLPSSDFFPFVNTLLERYKNASEIFAIGGTNILRNYPQSDSYVYSLQGSIWGWASWRRAWKNYDLNIEAWEDRLSKETIKSVSFYNKVFEKRAENFDKVLAGEVDTWDYQWLFTRLKHKGLTVLPKVNLVSNIGFGRDATHTLLENPKFSKVSTGNLQFPLKFPDTIELNEKFEKQYLKYLFGQPQKSFFNKVFNKLRALR